MSTNLEYRAGERQRKRESWQQASKVQWEKRQQRSSVRDKKQRRHFFVGGTTWKFCSGGDKMGNGQFQKISIPNNGRLPCFNPPPPLAFRNSKMPQNSITVNPPPPLQNFMVFLEVHFWLSNAYMNKRTWIYASSRLWSSSAWRQALLFSDKKNLLLLARLCKLLFKS